MDEKLAAMIAAARVNPTGELPAPINPMEAMAALNSRDGFEMTDADQRVLTVNPAQLAGHFLIDRDGIIRWTNLEAAEGLEGLGKFPAPTELLATAKALVGSRVTASRLGQ